MITHFSSFLGKLRRLFSRHEWAVRLARLPRSSEKSPGHGLVFIQIDGLSLTQFQRAMQKGRLPFLKHLLNKEKYVLHSVYSGLPSNTPAFQGELFYGVKSCVPAFSFVKKETGQVMRMYDAPCAQMIESALAERNQPLLKGGSSYSNIFTGGADEAHFCASKIGWGGVWHAVKPYVFPFLILCYLDIFIRTLALMLIEFFLAVYDGFRAVLQGKKLKEVKEEFKFIPARVFICVLLRELVVAGACMDIARGLPVIHANLIGYDEQSHRRGPSSLFAHWSLHGIDDGIRRIWEAAWASDHRDYDIWVYSDHGQEKTSSYTLANGQTVGAAVEKILGEAVADKSEESHHLHAKGSDWRAGFLHEMMETGAPVKQRDAPEKTGRPVVTAMGPLGHVYLPSPPEEGDIPAAAMRLVNEAHVPLVLAKDGKGRAAAWTKEGRFELPAQSAQIFGEDHPFLEEAGQDLIDVCHHPDAGHFILAGWTNGLEPATFPLENGAHAGLGPEETRGFAFLPLDCPLKPRSKKYLRPLDLREAALQLMNKEGNLFFIGRRRPALPAKTFRMMTYNVHGCVGMDGKLSTDRIARVIARHEPDVIALQELDVGRMRSGGVDQAERIARRLEMSFHFQPAFRLKDEQYGNAILSRYPIGLVKMGPLPRLRDTRDCEPRGAIWVTVDLGGTRVQIVNTHLSIWPYERRIQIGSLLGQEWLSHVDCREPVVFCGDFNSVPGSHVYKRIQHFLADSLTIRSEEIHHTWSARYPLQRLDHVFVSGDMDVLSIHIPSTRLDQVASDHLPVIVELKAKY